MHLDCVFSILGDDICLMLKDMMGTESPTRRLVDEYAQDPVSGTWHLERERVEFSAYMRDNGYHIIEIAGPDQLVRPHLPPPAGCRARWLGSPRAIQPHRAASASGPERQAQASPAGGHPCCPHAAGLPVRRLRFRRLACWLMAAVHAAVRLQRPQPGGGQDHQRPLGHSAPDCEGPQLPRGRADRGLLLHHLHVRRCALQLPGAAHG